MTGSFLACESRTHFAVRRIMSLPANPATPRDYFPLASQTKRGLCAVKKKIAFFYHNLRIIAMLREWLFFERV